MTRRGRRRARRLELEQEAGIKAPSVAAPAPVPPEPFNRGQLIRYLHVSPATKHIQSAVSFAFELMGIAEQELERVKLDELSRKTNLFELLKPPASMCEPSVVTAVYRAHCRELLMRVRDHHRPGVNLPLDPPTKAELLMALSNSSLKAMLRPTAALVMEQCFAEVFDKPKPRELALSEKEELTSFMIQCRVPGRRLVARA